ncbi:site-specific integrase [Yersinia alsatica]|uniref:site-specific integrase n=1 Tax=Yersinia alsatica TaxID=2890317 RepID=UPI0011AACF13|nr:site-specific integrase [Yersinia alsatica]
MSHLMLSRHGIWYYRRVYLTPRKRREIRISLRTRSKREALLRVEKYLTSQPFPCLPQDTPAHTASATAASTPTKPKKSLYQNLLRELEKYILAKTDSVGERELLTINRCVKAYLSSTQQPFSKRSAANFVDTLGGSASTRNRYIKKNSAFLKWLARRTDEDIRNPFEGMGIRETTAPMDRRPAYSLDDLKRLSIAMKEVKDWRSWIILICRYSGMRQNEACQLYHNDIMQVDSVWCFRIDNLNPHQTLKTDSSRRFVPVHPQLLMLGLLEFAHERTGHLFPELKQHLGSYGHYFSRWFTRFRTKHALPEFHSLRHYAATTFKKHGFPEQFASQVLGHANITITYNRYGKGVDVSRLIELVGTL